MVAQSNGADTGPLAGWAVVQSQGLTLIGRATSGKLTGTGHYLRPVYELKPQMAMGERGMQLAHVALPVWLLGVPEWEIADSDHVTPCESFTREQRQRLHAACDGAAQLQEQMRQEGARVQLAPASALAGIAGRKP
jgi:hypothetical protein